MALMILRIILDAVTKDGLFTLPAGRAQLKCFRQYKRASGWNPLSANALLFIKVLIHV